MSKRAVRDAKPDDPASWPSRRQALSMLAIVGLGTLGGGLAWRAARPAALAGNTAPSGAVARLELRPTLDPASFTGKARRAYEVAQEMPALLDRLKCYCRCDPYGHRTLLSCYTDSHAAT
jgi:hypothetical protein